MHMPFLESRSLNLSNVVAIVIYEAWRQVDLKRMCNAVFRWNDSRERRPATTFRLSFRAE